MNGCLVDDVIGPGEAGVGRTNPSNDNLNSEYNLFA